PEQTGILVAPDRRPDEPGGHPALPVSWSPLAFVAFGLIALSAECEASTVAILPRRQRGCQGTAGICSQGNPDSELVVDDEPDCSAGEVHQAFRRESGISPCGDDGSSASTHRNHVRSIWHRS